MDEMVERGIDVLRYLSRNGIHSNSLYREQQLRDLAEIGAGTYQQPLITPYELSQLCYKVRKKASRGSPVYRIGNHEFSIYYNDGTPSLFKSSPMERVVFPKLDLTLVLREVGYNWPNNGGSVRSLIWDWETVTDEALMLLVISLPTEYQSTIGAKNRHNYIAVP